MDEFQDKKTLSKRQVNNIKFGTVLIVNDKLVFNHKGKVKARRVVVIGKKNGSLIVAPIRNRVPNVMELSRFDGKRCVRLDKYVLITKNKIYTKKGFKKTNNDFLTKAEKVELKRKVIKYKK